MIHPPSLRFASLVIESVLVFLCFATTLHQASQQHPFSVLALPGSLAGQTLLASLFFVAAWMMLVYDLRQQQLRQVLSTTMLRPTLSALAMLTLLAVLIFEALQANWNLAQIILRFWKWSLSVTGTVFAANSFARRFLSDSHHSVLILGTGPLAGHAWRELRTKHCRSLNVIGFSDTSCMASASFDVKARYLGNLADLETLLLKHAVDLIVVALPIRSCYDAIHDAVATAKTGGLELVSFNEPFTSGPEQVRGSYSSVLFEAKYNSRRPA
jgi:FlaA1/EpsC-like NDP-sugar epimerase